MKKCALKRKTPLRQKSQLRSTGTKLKKNGRRTKSTKTQRTLPFWFKTIPKAAGHGSEDEQKRLWRLVTDYCRIRDWYRYDGKCVATGQYFDNWKLLQGGHYIEYTKCHVLFKFDVRNVHAQSPASNKFDDKNTTGYRYAKELERRYGAGYVEMLWEENEKRKGGKFYAVDIVQYAEYVLNLMEQLPEKPDYYKKVMDLYGQHNVR